MENYINLMALKLFHSFLHINPSCLYHQIVFSRVFATTKSKQVNKKHLVENCRKH